MKIILFNGPPGSGKDTAARFLYEQWNVLGFPNTVAFERMSFPNKSAFAAITGTEMDEFFNNLTYEKIKEEPLFLLDGKSYRQWQIDFSESFMKPFYGSNIFSRLFIERLVQRTKNRHRDDWLGKDDVILVPDCGFEVEAETLHNHLHDVYLVRVHRPGYDFSRDSRSYLKADRLPPTRIFDVFNHGSKSEFEETIYQLTKGSIL